MITLYGFGNMSFSGGVGETKDLWAQWVLEETGLPYRVHALDHAGGELDSVAFRRISPFGQAPVIDDDGFVLSESGAIALYLAQKSRRLIPDDDHGRTCVAQWCFAAVATVYPTFLAVDLAAMFDSNKEAPQLHRELGGIAGRWIADLETRLNDRDWIACAQFTVADIMMAGVLRTMRKSDLLATSPAVKAYFDRCFARPAWQHTLELYADRLGVGVEEIR